MILQYNTIQYNISYERRKSSYTIFIFISIKGIILPLNRENLMAYLPKGGGGLARAKTTIITTSLHDKFMGSVFRVLHPELMNDPKSKFIDKIQTERRCDIYDTVTRNQTTTKAICIELQNYT